MRSINCTAEYDSATKSLIINTFKSKLNQLMLVSLSSPTRAKLSSVNNYNVMNNWSGNNYSIILSASKLSQPCIIKVPIKNTYLEYKDSHSKKLEQDKLSESKKAITAKNSLVNLMSSIPGIEPPKSL